MARRQGTSEQRSVIVVSDTGRRLPRPPNAPEGPRRPAAPPPPKPVLGLPALVRAAVKEATRLEKQPRWTVALKGAAPDVPLLVERLDQPGHFYAIVAFRFGERISARIRLDAHDARPGAAMGIDARRRALTPFRTADDARKRMMTPVADDVVVDPFLVWRPCLQSPNAFLPFYRVRRKAKQGFYRIDAEFFESLSVASGV